MSYSSILPTHITSTSRSPKNLVPADTHTSLNTTTSYTTSQPLTTTTHGHVALHLPTDINLSPTTPASPSSKKMISGSNFGSNSAHSNSTPAKYTHPTPSTPSFQVATHSRFVEDAEWSEEDEEELMSSDEYDSSEGEGDPPEKRKGQKATKSTSSTSTSKSNFSSHKTLKQRHTNPPKKNSTKLRTIQQGENSSASDDSGTESSDSEDYSSDNGSHSHRHYSDSKSDEDTSDDEEDSTRRLGKEEDEALEEASLEPYPPSVSIMVRIAMCALSLLLLWITALSLANYIASTVVGAPSFGPIYDSWVASFAVADRQGEMHNSCVSQIIAGCTQRLNDSSNAAEAEWNTQEQEKANELASIQANANGCDQASTGILTGIRSWMTARGRVQYQDSICTVAEVDNLRSLLNDPDTSPTQLQSLSSNYVNNTNSLFQQSQEQVQILQNYNVDFVNNQSVAITISVQGEVDQLRAAADPTSLIANLQQQFTQLQTVTQWMRDCAEGNNINNPYCPIGSLVDQYNVILTEVNGDYSNLRDQGQQLEIAIIGYSNQVQSKFREVQSFFDYLSPFANAMSTIGVDILNMPTLDVPPFVVPGAFDQALVARSVEEFRSFMSGQFQSVQQLWQDAWQTTVGNIETTVQAAMNNIYDIIQSYSIPSLSDAYQPPTDQVEASLAFINQQLDESSQTYIQANLDGIDAILNKQVTGVTDALNSLYNSTLSQSAAAAAAAANTSIPSYPNSFNLSSDSIHIPYVTFTGSFSLSTIVIGLISSMGGIFVIGDYLFRNLQSIRLIYSYIKHPQEMLPPIDGRTKEHKKQEEAEISRSGSILQKLAQVLANPAMLIFVGLIFAAWCIGLFLAVYIPFYQDYQQGCVESSSPNSASASVSSGSSSASASSSNSFLTSGHSNHTTFLATNAFVLFYNYASLRGNTALVYLLPQFEARRSYMCGRYEARKYKADEDRASKILVALNTQKTASDHMNLISKCLKEIDLPMDVTPPSSYPLNDISDALLQQCQVTVTADGSVQSQYYTSAASASDSSSTYSASSFNCSFLPTCEIGSLCPGPDAETIHASTHDTSCATEYAFHQGLFYFAFAALIFICLNLSRYFAVKAMVRIGWKALTPAGLTFISTCDHRGRVIQETELASEREGKKNKRETSTSSSQDLSDYSSSSFSKRNRKRSPPAVPVDQARVTRQILKRHVEAYENSANRYLILTLLSHLPYLILLFALKDPFNWGSSVKIAEPIPYNQQH